MNRIKLFFLKNPLQKFLAISFAVIIWAFAPSLDKKEITEMQIFVPLTYTNIPQDLIMVTNPAQTVGVTLKIEDNKIPNPSLFQAVVDLKTAVPGEKEFIIKSEDLKHPDKVLIDKISPDRLVIEFEKVVEKLLTIKPVITGEVAKGYVLEKVVMIPESVLVRGPVSIMDKMQQLETKSINVDNINHDMEFVTSVNYPKRINTVGAKPEYYTARLKVSSEPINIRFLNIPIGIVNQEYVTRINPKFFNVLLRGPRSTMEYFTKSDVQAFIDLENYAPGEYKIDASKLTLRLRPEIQVLKIWPPIHIWVKKQKIDE